MTTDRPVYTVTEEGFPFGPIRCNECDDPIQMGEQYTVRPEGMMGDTPVTESVCLRCGEGGEG